MLPPDFDYEGVYVEDPASVAREAAEVQHLPAAVCSGQDSGDGDGQNFSSFSLLTWCGVCGTVHEELNPVLVRGHGVGSLQLCPGSLCWRGREARAAEKF